MNQYHTVIDSVRENVSILLSLIIFKTNCTTNPELPQQLHIFLVVVVVVTGDITVATVGDVPFHMAVHVPYTLPFTCWQSQYYKEKNQVDNKRSHSLKTQTTFMSLNNTDVIQEGTPYWLNTPFVLQRYLRNETLPVNHNK